MDSNPTDRPLTTMSQLINEKDIRTMPPPPAPSIFEQNPSQKEVSEFFTDISMDHSELGAPIVKERGQRVRKPNESKKERELSP